MKWAFGWIAVVASTLSSAVAWGTVGGPSYVTDVRYDPATRTVYWVRVMDESDWPPSVKSFRVARPDEAVWKAVTHSETSRDPVAAWETLSGRLETLSPLRASMGADVHMRFIEATTDSAHTEWWGPFERRIAVVELRSGGLVGRARITTYIDHTIRRCNVYDVPGGRRLVILRARSIPFEMTYDEDTPVLLVPSLPR
jgi:hypothetical protein